MSKTISTTTLALLLALCGTASAADIEAILKKADAFRLPAASLQVETQVQTFKDGKESKEKRYQVLIRPGGKSLVLFRSPGETGQKVLMSGDDFWMYLPGSARPFRITPLQKLLGDASTGDIANMTWSDDYDGSVAREVEVDGVACLELELAAQRKSLSYQRIVLQVAKSDFRPMHADLYASSNRKIKQAHFKLGSVDGQPRVTQMILIDEVQTNRETRVNTLHTKARSFGDELFNPMYLSRSDVLP
ncbi:outer membrane lipoprotein-sorting protein [Massilia sp. erpn]|uniref:outer membrane lipoprotein-sorting protein n=1 Tax=Massilia sp. erpn TaxID=2738142 RepID=UPI002108357C|nr:outer membrane lipoprotein-sorting protein [Massilia sp. erpn]UTY58601.1 outer membrane lipoprotein-sorting protein [Massilia sp. erpn]